MRLRLILTLALALVAGLLALNLSIYIFGSWASAPFPATIAVPEDLRAEKIEWVNAGGFKIRGSWLEGAPGRPVIVLAHGIRATRNALWGRARFLNRAGHSVLLFDFGAHGESEGERITVGLRESQDVRHAVGMARARRPGSKVGVLAISMGAAATVLGEAPLKADAVILEAMFPSIATAIDNRIARWLGPVSKLLTPFFIWQMEQRMGFKDAEMSPIAHVAELHAPVMIVSGGGDRYTTEAETREIFARVKEPKLLTIIPQAGHVDLHAYNPAIYEPAISYFLKKYL